MSAVPFPTTDSQPTRFLFVSSVPQDTLTDRLQQALVGCGDLKDISVTFRAQHGAKILAFHDIGHSLRAHRAINMPSRSFGDIQCQARFMTSEELDLAIVQHFFDGFTKPCQVEVVDATDPFVRHLHSKLCPQKSTTPVDFEAKALPCDSRPGVKNTISIPFPPISRRLSLDSSLSFLRHDAHKEERETGRRPRCTSNRFHFDSTDKPVVLPSPPRPQIISAASDTPGLGFVDASFPLAPPSSASLPSLAPHPLPQLFFSTAAIQVPCLGSPRELQEQNRIDIARIERGDDPRTSVMIKNIPNKMRRERLVKFIHKVCPRGIDFLYLRVDFSNGCNVGYAFVNFSHVQDLLRFVKVKLGKKWNLFSSEKILGMRYANYQGKEALMEKFRSSPIMDEREEWRPVLFHSDGALRGLPEDFSPWGCSK